MATISSGSRIEGGDNNLQEPARFDLKLAGSSEQHTAPVSELPSDAFRTKKDFVPAPVETDPTKLKSAVIADLLAKKTAESVEEIAKEDPIGALEAMGKQADYLSKARDIRAEDMKLLVKAREDLEAAKGRGVTGEELEAYEQNVRVLEGGEDTSVVKAAEDKLARQAREKEQIAAATAALKSTTIMPKSPEVKPQPQPEAAPRPAPITAAEVPGAIHVGKNFGPETPRVAPVAPVVEKPKAVPVSPADSAYGLSYLRENPPMTPEAGWVADKDLNKGAKSAVSRFFGGIKSLFGGAKKVRPGGLIVDATAPVSPEVQARIDANVKEAKERAAQGLTR